MLEHRDIDIINVLYINMVPCNNIFGGARKVCLSSLVQTACMISKTMLLCHEVTNTNDKNVLQSHGQTHTC